MRQTLILMLWISALGCAQKEFIVELGDDGAKISEGYNVNDLKEGKWVYFTEEADTLYIMHFRRDTLLTKQIFVDGVVARRIKYDTKGLPSETYTYYPDKEIESVSYPIEGKNIGVTIAFFENGQPMTMSFHLLNDESGPLATNQRVVGSFVGFYQNGGVYTSSKSMEDLLYNVYDTTGMLVYKVDGSSGDTLYRNTSIEPHFVSPPR